MHIDIAFNLIRHITSPSCDKFIEGLKEELNDPKVHSEDHKEKEKNSCRGGKKEGFRQKDHPSSGPTVETGRKDGRAAKNFKEYTRTYTPSPPMPKRPPFDVRHTPPAHPVPHAEPVAGGSQGQQGHYSPASSMPKCPPPVSSRSPPAPPVRLAGSGFGDSLDLAGTSSTSSVASSGVPAGAPPPSAVGPAVQSVLHRVRTALEDPVLQKIPYLPPGSEVRKIQEGLTQKFHDLLQEQGEYKDAESSTSRLPLSGDSSGSTGVYPVSGAVRQEPCRERSPSPVASTQGILQDQKEELEELQMKRAIFEAARQLGIKARIVNLEGRRDLNGSFATIIQQLPAAKRYRVRLENCGAKESIYLAIKPENLEIALEEDTPERIKVISLAASICEAEGIGL